MILSNDKASGMPANTDDPRELMDPWSMDFVFSLPLIEARAEST